MPKPTRRREQYNAARLVEAQAEFLAAASAAGHEARTYLIGAVNGVPVGRVFCSCNRYRSPLTSELAARRAWLSHARGIILNPSTRVAS